MIAHIIVDVLLIFAASMRAGRVRFGNVMPVMIARSAASMNLILCPVADRHPAEVLAHHIRGHVRRCDIEPASKERAFVPAIAPIRGCEACFP